MVPPSTASSSKALGAILPLIASGQAYEAHQKARTFASRYSKSSQYDTAIQVLFQSAKELFKAGQQGSGTDLTVFLLEVYESKGEVVDEESRGMFSLMALCLGGVSEFLRCLSVICRAINAAYCSNWIIRYLAKDDYRQIYCVCYFTLIVFDKSMY
jgi:hypothetical protein